MSLRYANPFAAALMNRLALASAALSISLVSARAAGQLVIQVDVKAVFNADVVVNDGTGTIDPSQSPADDPAAPGSNFAFCTAAVATALDPGGPNGLPNNGYFPATDLHPEVQLHYSNANDDNNARRAAAADSFTFGVPLNRYAALHLLATSANAATLLGVTFHYHDGTTSTATATVPEWTSTVAGSADLYALAAGRTAVRPTAPFQVAAEDRYSIFGLRLAPDPKRFLQSVTVSRPVQAGVLDFFGATGVTAVQAGCAAPGGSAFPLTADTITSGQTYSVSWTDAAGLSQNGAYALEGSRSPDFGPLAFRYLTTSPALTFSTNSSGSDFTLYLRVKAVQPCGAVGPDSPALAVLEKAAPARAVFTTSGPAWITVPGAPPPSTTVVLRNVGGLSGDVSFTAKDAFFTVDPPMLPLPPGASATVTLTPLASAVAEAGFHYTRLIAKTGSQTTATPVTLSVTPNPAGDLSGLTVKSSASRVVFVAPAGQNPAPQIVELTLSAPVPGVRLAARIGPGGTWLGLNAAELSRPVDATGKIALTLTVDRSQRTNADGASPLRSLVRFHPAGAPNDLAHSAIIEVIDTDAPTVTANASASRPGSGKAFILPAAVKAAGQSGATFFSDGWVRNLAPRSVIADLFFTPDGKDGTKDPSVLKSTVSVGPGEMLRVSDLLGSIFGTSGTGLVDVRTTTPLALTVRSTVESVTGGDPTSRYGTELPVVGRGSGAGVGDPVLVIPGISDDDSNRANLILAETSGASVTAEATLYAANGGVLGSLSRTIPPYSKVQVNRVGQALAQGSAVSGGYLGVKATAGQGKVVPLATVIDNRSNSFSAIRGRPLQAPAGTARWRALAAAGVAPGLVIPSAARLTGAFDTHYTTTMSMVNGTAQPADLTMTYNYVDVADGGKTKSVTKTWTIPPRGALDKPVGDDVLANLFGVTTPSYGWVQMDGDTASIVATAGISAAVDSTDPSKGVKTAQVNGVTTDSPDLIAAGDPEHRFTGAEKSDAKRTNLILLETTGAPSDVLVRVYTPTGEAMAERIYSVNGGEYLQINDLFGDAGLGLGDGPFQNVEVTAEVTSGAGEVIAFATVVDNVSRNPEIFLLETAGAPPASVGF